MPSWLVTGGAGFIGANFAKRLVRTRPDERVVVVDALTYAGCRDSIDAEIRSGQIEFVHADICDKALMQELLESRAIDTIAHFAAESHVDRSITGPDEFVRTNLVGTHALLSAARAAWLQSPPTPLPHRFHHVSTDEVFGSLDADAPAFNERTRYAPNSPYSASKAGSDFLVRAYHETYGLDVTISNCSNNYGPYQFPEKLIPLTLANALLGRRIGVYGDGSNIRDWLHVEDHCRGLERVVLDGVSGQTYNIGGNCERSNLDLVRLICACLDEMFGRRADLAEVYPDCPAAVGQSTSTLIEFVEDRAGHDWRYAIDASKIERELGFSPKVALSDGIDQLIDWMLDNRAWWLPKLAVPATLA